MSLNVPAAAAVGGAGTALNVPAPATATGELAAVACEPALSWALREPIDAAVGDLRAAEAAAAPLADKLAVTHQDGLGLSEAESGKRLEALRLGQEAGATKLERQYAAAFDAVRGARARIHAAAAVAGGAAGGADGQACPTADALRAGKTVPAADVARLLSMEAPVVAGCSDTVLAAVEGSAAVRQRLLVAYDGLDMTPAEADARLCTLALVGADGVAGATAAERAYAGHFDGVRAFRLAAAAALAPAAPAAAAATTDAAATATATPSTGAAPVAAAPAAAVADPSAAAPSAAPAVTGAAFEAALTTAMAAVKASTTHVRRRSPDGSIHYEATAGGATATEAPAAVAAMMNALLAADVTARCVEDEAVTEVAPELIQDLAAALVTHLHDPGVAGILLNALGRLADNADNHAAIKEQRIVETVLDAVAVHQALVTDPRVCEGIVAIILPLSFDTEAEDDEVTSARAIALLVDTIKRYSKQCTNYFGAPVAWLAGVDEVHNARVAVLVAGGAEVAERNKALPRLANGCVQALANLACMNEPDAAGSSPVTRIVDHGGIEALGELMSLHIDNPRLLEDSICALSNMAFVSDTIQLSIGRSCLDAVCTALAAFNGDGYLFQMTMRAIGSLTRCDENVMRAVGFGVASGIAEGMRKHAHDPAVLQLCADVIGNMASVDDKKVGREEGVRILLAAAQRRRASNHAAQAGAAGAAAAGAASPSARARDMLPDRLRTVGLGATPLKEAVCAVLYESGAARAVMDAMAAHASNSDLVASCLRTLHYIGATSELVHRMVDELSLVTQAIAVMRANGSRPDILRRGARILSLAVGSSETLKGTILEAGAPAVLLRALEMHKTAREMCITCFSVTAMMRSPAMVRAVLEHGAIDTAVAALRSFGNDHEFVGVLLELLWGWAAEAELAQQVADRAGAHLIRGLRSFTTGTAVDLKHRLQHQNYILNTILALCRHGVGPTHLLGAGLLRAMEAVVAAVIAAGDGRTMLDRRSLVMLCATIMATIVEPGRAAVSKRGVDALVEAGAGPLLERMLAAYKSVPDPREKDQQLYDEALCSRVYGVLQYLMTTGGYVPLAPVTLDDVAVVATSAAAGAAAAVGSPGASAAPASGGAGTMPVKSS